MNRMLLGSSVACLVACGAANDATPRGPDICAGRPAPASLTNTTEAKSPEPPTLRLPEGARPRLHAATLTVVPSADTFDGEITIAIDVTAPLHVLWLNADSSIVVERADVEGKPAKIVPGGQNFVGLALDAPLAPGQARAHLVYKGKLSATDVDGASRQNEGGAWYVYTHFEPIAARRVFPCFDEPAYKAPWQLTLRVKKGDTALSNTPVAASEEGADGFTTVRFKETKPLPSYLVAFAVGPFGLVDAGKVGATPIRIVTPRGKEPWARYAAEATGPILTLLEKYFETPYPYEKLDVIAVPLFGGAMENPGLVTYRQGGILSRPDHESTSFRRGYASTTAHELAHQWFGDLVTTGWWDDLWLNEAFATWMAPKIVERYRPEWNLPDSRAAQANGAMRTDSLVSARQIRQPIASNDDIRNAFDGITYQKGASVIAMFERYVGPEKFQKGVQRYMREHAHGTATAKDFLAAISAEAGRDISAPFSTFLDQPGVPLLKNDLQCDAKSARLAFSESRYLPAGSDGSENPRTPWQVPVCARFSVKGKVDKACTLVDGAHGELGLASCPDWIYPNDGASGYYRTGWDPRALERITKRTDVLTGPEKIELVGDLAALSRAGKLDYSALLALVPALAKDKDVHVVDAVVGPVVAARDLPLVTKEARPKLAKFVQTAFGARARALGLRAKPGEDDETRWLRPAIVDLVADVGEDTQLRAECTKLAKTWLADKKAVEPELVGTVLGVAAAFGDRALFDAFVADAKKTPERVDRDRLLVALGHFRDPAIVPLALDLALSDEFDPRESIRVIGGVSRMPETAPIAWAFVTKNFDALVARLPRDAGAAFPGYGAALCDDGRREEVESFFKERAKRFVGGPRVLAQSLEAMHLCSVFRRAEEPKVTAYLSK